MRRFSYKAVTPDGKVLQGETEAATRQAEAVKALGGRAKLWGDVAPDAALAEAGEASAVLWWGDAGTAKDIAATLADRDGPIVPLITAMPDRAHVLHERHLCVDTTAAGGNARLLAQSA